MTLERKNKLYKEENNYLCNVHLSLELPKYDQCAHRKCCGLEAKKQQQKNTENKVPHAVLYIVCCLTSSPPPLSFLTWTVPDYSSTSIPSSYIYRTGLCCQEENMDYGPCLNFFHLASSFQKTLQPLLITLQTNKQGYTDWKLWNTLMPKQIFFKYCMTT